MWIVLLCCFDLVVGLFVLFVTIVEFSFIWLIVIIDGYFVFCLVRRFEVFIIDYVVA